ncbi:unnamed protein product, partial [Staurois parvus]
MSLVPFIGFFGLWARTQGPHDPLLPEGPMSCQSAPALPTTRTDILAVLTMCLPGQLIWLLLTT